MKSVLRRERMAATQIVPGLYVISAGPVNTFLLESSDGCTLIDTGLPGSADKILQAIVELGKQLSGPHRPRQSGLE